ncbi:MAG: hypothetical protein HRU43_04000 [Simkaniaceae bacterium]|nr:hypothetical protein [Simkaniaceae bacterium]
MKKILCTLWACGFATALFADEAPPRAGFDYQKTPPPEHRDLAERVFDKDGWRETGVEWLFFTSNLTPSYFDNQTYFAFTDAAFRNARKRVQYLDSDYNSGFSAFVRYRPSTNKKIKHKGTICDRCGNDIGLYYSYIHNKGDGKLKTSDSYRYTNSNNGTFNAVFNQNNKGHQTSHLHIIDLLVRRLFPLTPQTIFSFSGGLSFTDFHLYFQYSNKDDLESFDDTGVLAEVYRQQIYSKATHKIWGLGPKGQFDFEYLFLPNCWDYSLNFYFIGQGALLYGKAWSDGRFDGESYNLTIFNPIPESRDDTYRWSYGSRSLLVPNLNLDFGLKYAYESLDSFTLKFAVGYRLISYWNMENTLTEKYEQGGFQPFSLQEHIVYTGPYARFSLAF